MNSVNSASSSTVRANYLEKLPLQGPSSAVSRVEDVLKLTDVSVVGPLEFAKILRYD